MYYHLMMKDGLKYKDLSIEEIEKIIDEKKLSYNNSRVYSSEKKLNQIFEIYKDDLNEQQNDINLENIKIEKLISMAERKKDIQNLSLIHIFSTYMADVHICLGNIYFYSLT